MDCQQLTRPPKSHAAMLFDVHETLQEPAVQRFSMNVCSMYLANLFNAMTEPLHSTPPLGFTVVSVPSFSALLHVFEFCKLVFEQMHMFLTISSTHYNQLEQAT
jgi:hypothetical protein